MSLTHYERQKRWLEKNPKYITNWKKKNPEYHKTYLKKWEVANQDKVKIYRKRRWNKKDEMIYNLKTKPCSDCGIVYHPFVMHFDHRDPSKKFKSISCMRSYSKENILAEIEKCDLVCANCHALRTYNHLIKGQIKIFGRYL